MMNFYLSNGTVAWQIPRGRISVLYFKGAYKPPPGWEVVNQRRVAKWIRQPSGELRRAISQEMVK